jgi:hypothetical protein
MRQARKRVSVSSPRKRLRLDRNSPLLYIARTMTTIATALYRRRRRFPAALAFDRV